MSALMPPPADAPKGVQRPPTSAGLPPAILRIIEALAVADVDRDYAAAQEADHDRTRAPPIA
jgi:hypothetical protein